MAHRVRMLLTNTEMRRRFGALSRRIALEEFSMDRMVERYTRSSRRASAAVAEEPPRVDLERKE